MLKELLAIIVILLLLLLSVNVSAVEVTCSFTATGGDPGEVAMQNPQPTNGSWRDIDNHTLQVLVFNQLGQTMNVSFYWINDTLISTDTNVANNTNAIVQYNTNYTRYETYEWYVTVNSTSYDNRSSTWWFKGEAYRWDVDRSAEIDIIDITSITMHFGSTGDPGWIRADVAVSGEIDITDITSVTFHFGEVYT